MPKDFDMRTTSRTIGEKSNQSMRILLYTLTILAALECHPMLAQAPAGTTSTAAGTPQDTSRLDSLKEISIEIRKIPEFYNYPLLVETLFDVTTVINKAANPNFPVETIPTIDKQVNYGQLSKESVASMKNTLGKIQAIPRYQESRLLLDASRCMTAAILKAQPH
jgi:hypothetical protein